MAKNKSKVTRSAPECKVPAEPRFHFFSNRNLVFINFLLFSLVAAVFLSAIRNDFLHWFGDDPLYVTENSHVNSGLTLENLRWAFFSTDRSNWHPLTWISHMLDCQIYGLKPWGHHLTSVLVHAANTVLLFIILRRMTGATWRSLAVALFFGLHPLRVEAVAWVADRKDLLSGFFFMLTLLMYVRYAEENKTRNQKFKIFYTLALLFFAFGLMSKGILVTLPFVLLLLDYWPLARHQEKSGWGLLIEKSPFLILAMAVSAITYIAQQSWGFVQTLEKYSMGSRLENAVVSYVRYIGKMFWPVDLCGFYPHPGHWPIVTVLLCAIFLLGITILAFVVRRHCSWLLVGWCWYLGTLVPVIGLVQLGDVAMADRYSYIPMIGILVLLVWGMNEWTKQWRYQNIVGSSIAAVILVLCTIITYQQIGYFKDGLTAWGRNFEVTRDVDVAQYAFGLALNRQGHTDEGIKALQAVLKSKPDRAEAHYNLANMLYKQSRADEAISHYFRAVELSPDFVQAHHNLGLILLRAGRFDEAGIHFQEVLRLDAKNVQSENMRADIHMNLGIILNRQGRADDAINHYYEAIKLSPNFGQARFNLGINLLGKGLTNDASIQFQEMVKLNNDARAYNALGTILASSDRLDETINYFKEAVKQKPDYAEAHNNLGMALTEKGLTEEAIPHFQEALKLNPDLTIARDYLDSIKSTGKAPEL